ncbi:MAG: UDP-N-acetylmuramoyl-tripeptide--D-alanyl-D-alanine ligase [Paenisporosarcina sp.]
MKKQLSQIAMWLEHDLDMNLDVLVTGVSINTKTLQPGDLFVPFKGERVNGHQYVQQAFSQGASAALWQSDEPNPPTHLPIIFVKNCEIALQQMARAYRSEHKATFIGITGSNGKTSTKDLVAGVLSPFFRVQKTAGNFNNNLGLPLTILDLDEDTEYAVLEMGMSGFGEIEFLSQLAKPHYVVITNIGEAHMQDLGSRAGIAKAKFEIVDGLQSEGKLFFDGDEPLLEPFVETFNGEAVSFGYEFSNSLSASNILATEKGSQFDVNGILTGTYSIPVLGKHQVKNALVAMLIAKEAGLTNKQIQESLEQVSLTDMRMQVIPASNDALFINDAYNAAPTSMKAALEFVMDSKIRSDKWVVLGDMLELGENERQFHQELVKFLPMNTINGVCLYGTRMKYLFEELQQHEWPEKRLLWTESDYEPIIQKLRQETSSNSMILVKGSRGMALEKVIEPFKQI